MEDDLAAVVDEQRIGEPEPLGGSGDVRLSFDAAWRYQVLLYDVFNGLTRDHRASADEYVGESAWSKLRAPALRHAGQHQPMNADQRSR
jgi:hypothetical protein